MNLGNKNWKQKASAQGTGGLSTFKCREGVSRFLFSLRSLLNLMALAESTFQGAMEYDHYDVARPGEDWASPGHQGGLAPNRRLF